RVRSRAGGCVRRGRCGRRGVLGRRRPRLDPHGLAARRRERGQSSGGGARGSELARGGIRHRMTRLPLAASAALLALVLASGTAGADRRVTKTESGHLRAWTVTLTYGLSQSQGGISKYLDLHLTASAHGVRRIDRTLPLPRQCGDFGCVSFGGPGSV